MARKKSGRNIFTLCIVQVVVCSLTLYSGSATDADFANLCRNSTYNITIFSQSMLFQPDVKAASLSEWICRCKTKARMVVNATSSDLVKELSGLFNISDIVQMMRSCCLGRKEYSYPYASSQNSSVYCKSDGDKCDQNNVVLSCVLKDELLSAVIPTFRPTHLAIDSVPCSASNETKSLDEKGRCAKNILEILLHQSRKLATSKSETTNGFHSDSLDLDINVFREYTTSSLSEVYTVPITKHSTSTVSLLRNGTRIVVVAEMGSPWVRYFDEFPVSLNDDDDDDRDLVAHVSQNISILAFLVVDDNSNGSDEIRFSIDTERDNSVLKTTHSKSHVTDLFWSCIQLDVGRRVWSNEGCDIGKSRQSSDVHCSCHRNSNKLNGIFTVVFAVREIRVPSQIQFVATVAEIISILFLFLTLFVLFLVRRKIGNFDRVTLQLNLCFALLGLHLMFLIGPMAVTYNILCQIAAAITHYLLLTAVVLMLISGFVMYFKTSGRNFYAPNASRQSRYKAIALSWTIPAVFVAICVIVAASYEAYLDTSLLYEELKLRANNSIENVQKYDRCWLGYRSKWIYSAFVPVTLAIFFNIYILLRLSYRVWSMSKRTEKLRPSDASDNVSWHTWRTIRALFLLLPVLGVPWCLSFCVNIYGAEIVFASLHAIVNGTQGIFIFLIFVVLNKNVRTSLKRRWGEFAVVYVRNVTLRMNASSAVTQ